MPTTPCIKAPVRRVSLGALAMMSAFPSAATAGNPAAGKV